MDNKNQIPLKSLEELNYFLASAPKNWKNGEVIKRLQIYEHEYISCVFWENQHFITGTDIVKALTYRFKIQGHEIKNVKKFEEGIFSDLRNLKPGIDSSLEEPKSPFLELLYKNKCIRTQKKQKVFFWYSVPYDRLYQDVLKRDKKRELSGKKSTVCMDKSKSPIIKKEKSASTEIPNNMNIVKTEPVDNNNNINNNTSCPNIIYTKWVDETQKLSNNAAACNSKDEGVKIKKEESENPQIKKVKKGRKYIITKYFAKGQVNNSSLKFVCDKKDCNKKFKKLEELVKHKKYVHGNDKIGYNYSKDFMYVEKNLSFDKSDKNQQQLLSPKLLSPKLANANSGRNNITLSPTIEFEDENNNWSIIISPDNSISSDESMISGNVSADVTNLSLNDLSLGSISNPNESMCSIKGNNVTLDFKNFTPYSLLNMKMQNSNNKMNNVNNVRDHRLSVSSNTTLNNINNSAIYSTANTTSDLADTSMNTTFLSNCTLNGNSSFIIQSSDNPDIVLTSEEQFRKFISQLIKSEDISITDNQNKILTPLNTSNCNTNTSYSETMVSQSQSQSQSQPQPQSQSQYVPCEMTNIPATSVQSQSMNHNYVSVNNNNNNNNNNNIPNVNDVAIPTAHFMALDSPVQTERPNYFQNISVPSQAQTQYIQTDQYNNNSTATSVQYIPSVIDTTSTSSNNYISYELTNLINQVTSAPVNVYLTSKVSPEPMNYVSSPTSVEYQRMNQPQSQPHTPSTSTFPNNTQPPPQQQQQQSMFYNLPNENNPVTMSQTYIQPQTQYVQVPVQPSQQQVYNIQHENVQTMVHMQYQ